MARPGRTKKRAAAERERLEGNMAVAIATVTAKRERAESAAEVAADLARRFHATKHEMMTQALRRSSLIPEWLLCDDCGEPFAQEPTA